MGGRLEAESPHQRKRLTILFSDIVGFTTLTDHLEPEMLSELLNSYLDAMAGLDALRARPHACVVLTTANAVLQKIPAADALAQSRFTLGTELADDNATRLPRPCRRRRITSAAAIDSPRKQDRDE